MRRLPLIMLLAVVLALLTRCAPQGVVPSTKVPRTTTALLPVKGTPPTATATRTPSATPTETATPTATGTQAEGVTDTPTVEPTVAEPTVTTPGLTLPYPEAPTCPDSGEVHDVGLFHTLWDAVRGCHYDHEHGDNPFTPEVAAAFPGLDLQALLGDTQIGNTNPSSGMENAMKHNGFEWQVDLAAPHGCELGFEGGQVAVSAYAIEYHQFGDYSVEMRSRVHSLTALLRQCNGNVAGDYGYVYTTQFADFGQCLFAYQGLLMPCAANPVPAYPVGLAPYFASDCIHCGAKQDTLVARQAAQSNIDSTWTSKSGARTGGQTLLAVLFRSRDLYQVVDQADQEQPLTFLYMCSHDGGVTYDPVGCRYNNSTTAVHEVQGTIPMTWDNLEGFDTDPRAGRITASGFTTDDGVLDLACAEPGPGCHPIVMVRAFTGFYSSALIPSKEDQFRPSGNPENDIYFCGGVVCPETDPGAQPSGWIGEGN